MSERTQNSRGIVGRRLAQLDAAAAQEWRNLAREFLELSKLLNADGIRLLEEKSDPEARGDFGLYHVDEAAEPWEKVVADPDNALWWERPVAETTFRNLAIRALLLAGHRLSERVWQDWAEFVVETIPYHRGEIDLLEEARGTREAARQEYLRGIVIEFVDESVMACQSREFRELTSTSEPVRRLWARGLRAFRERSGLSQEGFAAEIGYSVRTVGRWEQGGKGDHKAGTPITADGLKRICGRFHCRPEDILNEAPGRTDPLNG